MAKPSTPDGARLGQELYQQWEKAMTTWWDHVLESPRFLGTMGKGLAAQTQARTTYERAVDEQLEKLHLPTRKDLVRVTRIATLLEERLLQQEDAVLALRDELAAARRDALTARVEANEARVELRDTLAALRAEIATAAGTRTTAPTDTPAATPRRPRSRA